MSILDKIEVEGTRLRRPAPVQLSVAVDETGGVIPAGLATQDEYVVRLRINTTFWANKAQYSSARKAAQTMMLHTLYADILAQISVLRSAAMNDDTDLLLRTCSKIENDLGLRGQ